MVLKALFKLAIGAGELDQNPAGGIRKGRELGREEILEDDEYLAALGRALPEIRAAVIALRETGARRGDVLGSRNGKDRLPLMWSEVDLRAREIRFIDTKEGEPRTVQITDGLYAVLRGLEASRLRGAEVFLDDRNEPLKPDYVQRRWKDACRQAGITGNKALLHILRHTFGTRLLDLGAPIHAVKELMGHASVTTTERYSHANEDRKRQAIAKLPQVTLG